MGDDPSTEMVWAYNIERKASESEARGLWREESTLVLYADSIRESRSLIELAADQDVDKSSVLVDSLPAQPGGIFGRTSDSFQEQGSRESELLQSEESGVEELVRLSTHAGGAHHNSSATRINLVLSRSDKTQPIRSTSSSATSPTLQDPSLSIAGEFHFRLSHYIS